MKNMMLVSLLSAGSALLAGCDSNQEPPIRENYSYQEAPIAGLGNQFVLDMDGDGSVDAILQRGQFASHVTYCTQEARTRFDNRPYNFNHAQEMSPEMREAANKILHSNQDLNYQTDKIEYDRRQSKK
jgi:hypothetical protein